MAEGLAATDYEANDGIAVGDGNPYVVDGR